MTSPPKNQSFDPLAASEIVGREMEEDGWREPAAAQNMWDDVAGQDETGSPGSDGASPYLGFALS